MRRIIYYLVALLIFSFYFGSCQQENNQTVINQNKKLTVRTFKNINELSKQEQQILYKAFTRLNFYQTANGFYKIKQKSGNEIAISENIYCFFQSILNKTNQDLIKLRSYNTRFGIWDNDTSATSDNDYHTNNDCMIFAIETLLHEFGKTGILAEDIRRDLTRLGYYDETKGTYGSCVQSALSCYFNVSPIEDIDNFTYGPNDGGKYCAIGRYSIGNNQYDYHAGIVNWSYNGTMTYRDKQWNDTINDYEETNGVFLKGNVLMLYKLTLK